jgi:acetyl esterase/lipase
MRRKFTAHFDVTVSEEKIAGVPSVIFTPKTGVLASNESKVLINLHGGGFFVGEPWPESIPIPAVARIRVIGIDYRMGPEYKFPAASEDVAAVYKALLRDHAPENIGMCGCSAGGKLTAQAVAWFQTHGLPRPGAIGLFGTGAESYTDGDSLYIGDALAGVAFDRSTATALQEPYFGKNPDFKNPLVSPLTRSLGTSICCRSISWTISRELSPRSRLRSLWSMHWRSRAA